MFWVKLEIGTIRCWYKLNATTDIALHQIAGIELGAKLFTDLPVKVIDTRFSQHPVEPTYSEEIILHLVKEQASND